jgi:Cytochrome c554 and c-prime
MEVLFMSRNHAVTSFAVLLVFSLFLSFALFSGCEKTTEKIVTEVVYDTVTVTETVHDTILLQIIAVDAVNGPDSIAQGGSVELTVDVTASPLAGELSYDWFATAGSFEVAEGDTVTWKAPDDPGAYTVSVHVTDGTYIGIGSRAIGVGMYAPTVTPYYVGGPSCSCHGSVVTAWEGTGHASAWATLQESGMAASYCNPCHTVQDPTPTPGNSGYDDAPIAKFVNVQCENCHGPASDHLAGTGTPVVSYDVMTCGKCHEGEHHPYLTEWEQSPHAFDLTAYIAEFGGSQSCWGCHEGVAASIRLSGDLSSFYRSGAIASRPDTTEVPFGQINCQTCHDSHSADNVGQLRTVADVHLVTTNGESPVISEGGAGKLCMHCHHARNGQESGVPNGASHFGPHSSPQADILAARTGYLDVAPGGFNWAGPSHLYIENSCKTCHLSTAEYGGPNNPAVTGHTFMPTTAACQYCHGTISSFRDIPAADDFDGDGEIEGLQNEVDGLAELLVEALVSSGLDTTGGLEAALGDTSISTLVQREAGWNLVLIESDASHGVHNPDYVVQLLQQSYLHLTGSLPKNTYAVEGENAVVRNW